MATKEFGAPLKTADDYTAEAHALVDGAKFPVSITVSAGKIIQIAYDTEWREGATVPVETNEQDEYGNAIIKYEENYTSKKLTAAQIKKIDAWIKDNLAE